MFYRNTLCLAVILLTGFMAGAQNGVSKKSNFIIRGNIGAAFNYYNSNEPDSAAIRPSYAWNIYGSLTIRKDKFSMPISFVVNQYDKSNKSPYAQLGITPTYKWAKLHIGNSYIPFSPLTFDGQSFRGIGVQLTPKFFRFASFYGRLNKAVDEDTSHNKFRVPRYSRTAYGAKIGVGNSSSFFDLIYFHAKDDSASSSFVKDNFSRSSVLAKENTVLGTAFKLTIVKKIILTGDAAVDALTEDLSLDRPNADSLNGAWSKFLNKIMPYNGSTLTSYAGQSSITYNTRNYNTNLGYKRVEPNFRSLGTPYLINDNELISWINNFSIAKGKVTVNTSLSQQHNNLGKKLNTELRTQVGSMNINAVLGQHFNINTGYSGYNILQKDGVIHINDSTRLRENISQFNVTPAYTFTSGDKISFISGSLGLSVLNDKNRVTSKFTSANNLSSSLSYALSFTNNPLSFSLNTLFSHYKQDTNTYRTYGATLGTSSVLLRKKNLNIQGNIGYFINHYNYSANQKNISYSLNIGYQLKKHSLNLLANYIYTPSNLINDIIYRTIPYAVSTKNLEGILSYNYTF